MHPESNLHSAFSLYSVSHAVIETTVFHVGMRSVNPSIEFSFSLLRKTTQVWLLQFYLPNMTGSGEIDSPKQFRASTFHTLVVNHEIYLTTLPVRHNTLLVADPFRLMLLHFSWLEMGNTRLLTASHLDLFLKKCRIFGRPQHEIQQISLSFFYRENLLLPSNT